MMNIAHKIPQHSIRRFARTAMAALAAASCLYGATPVLSRLEMIGSGRGMALTLGADGPFAVSVHQKKAAAFGETTVSIVCSEVIYGLNDYQFDHLPGACPVRRITARENKDGKSVELVMQVSTPIDKVIRSKQKENRWIVLLTSGPVNDFAWSAQNETESRPVALGAEKKAPSAGLGHSQGSPQSTASSFLEDISVQHRDRVEKVILKLDSPADIIVKCTPGKILVLFVNTKNGLTHTTFKTEKDWLVKSIDINEVTHGGTKWLGASILVNLQGGSPPVIQTLPDRLVIYSVRDTKQCLYSWSAKNGTMLSYDFMRPEQLSVDYTKIEKKVQTDSKNDFPESGTFSVGEPKAANTRNEPKRPIRDSASVASSAAYAPRVQRLTTIKDNVNLRSAPDAGGNGAIVARLSLGATGTLEEKKGLWVKISVNGDTGWVARAMVLDSEKVPRSVWNKVEALAAEKKAFEDKKRLREEELQARAQAKTAAIAAAKAAAEEKAKAKALAIEAQKAKKKAEAEEKAKIAQQAKDVQLAKVQAAQKAKSEAVEAYDDTLSDSATQPAKPLAKVMEYHVLGRDPFMPLLQDEEGPLPSIERLLLVGILYDAMDKIALFEDSKNKAISYARRENDPVKNGYVLRIQSDKVLFLINELGISRTYAMKLIKNKEK
jgi:hypothetical protein